MPWKEIFKKIEELPLGSASIAQVHKSSLERWRGSCCKDTAKRDLR